MSEIGDRAKRGHVGVRGRFAPSPSGRMHLGNVFSALLSWLSARSQGGSFVIRLEDLDERCKNPQASEQLLDDLAWLGIDWDDQPLVQSEHIARYERAFEAICAHAEVYPCFCSRADLHAASAPHASDGSYVYAQTCRFLTSEERLERASEKNPAMRLHVPDAVYRIWDVHKGPYEQNLARGCGDFVIRRSDGVYAYQLVCVVDDAADGITEVVRGQDLLSSAPRQRYLYGLLGLEAPVYGHHPMLLAPDGRRLSKRDRDCDMGYIRSRVRRPEVICGFLASLAGLVPAGMEATPSELVGEFAWSKIPQRDVVLDIGKLPFELP